MAKSCLIKVMRTTLVWKIYQIRITQTVIILSLRWMVVVLFSKAYDIKLHFLREKKKKKSFHCHGGGWEKWIAFGKIHHTYAHTHVRAHTYMHTHTNIYTHVRMQHARARTHAHTRTHTFSFQANSAIQLSNLLCTLFGGVVRSFWGISVIHEIKRSQCSLRVRSETKMATRRVVWTAGVGTCMHR